MYNLFDAVILNKLLIIDIVSIDNINSLEICVHLLSIFNYKVMNHK